MISTTPESAPLLPHTQPQVHDDSTLTLERAINEQLNREKESLDSHAILIVGTGLTMTCLSYAAGYMLSFALITGSLATLAVPIGVVAGCALVILILRFVMVAKLEGGKEAIIDSLQAFVVNIVIPFGLGSASGAITGQITLPAAIAKGALILADIGVHLSSSIILPVTPFLGTQRIDPKQKKFEELFERAQKQLKNLHASKEAILEYENKQQTELQEMKEMQKKRQDDLKDFIEVNNIKIDRKLFFSNCGLEIDKFDPLAKTINLPEPYRDTEIIKLMDQFINIEDPQKWEKLYGQNPLPIDQLLALEDLANYLNIASLRESCHNLFEARLIRNPDELLTYSLDNLRTEEQTKMIFSMFNANYLSSDFGKLLTDATKLKLNNFLLNRSDTLYSHTRALMSADQVTELQKLAYYQEYLPACIDLSHLLRFQNKQTNLFYLDRLRKKSVSEEDGLIFRSKNAVRKYNAQAQFEIAWNDYTSGRPVMKHNFLSALDGGCHDAARYYIANFLTEQGDFQKYVQLAEHEARLGNPQAQLGLSSCLEAGKGVAKDLGLSIYWKLKASRGNYLDVL